MVLLFLHKGCDSYIGRDICTDKHILGGRCLQSDRDDPSGLCHKIHRLAEFCGLHIEHLTGYHTVVLVQLCQFHRESIRQTPLRPDRPQHGREPLCYDNQCHTGGDIWCVVPHIARGLPCVKLLDCRHIRWLVDRYRLRVEGYPREYILRHIAHGGTHKDRRHNRM